nr:MAG: RNA-dependent RNA polymerase [Astroviridae sp.]
MDTVNDPLLNLVEKYEQHEYVSSTWGPEAYTKMFEKFYYSMPDQIEEKYQHLWDFATSVVLKEYGYMQDSVVTPIISTTKNMDSTPAFPKFLKYSTERDYVENNGWMEYVKIWNTNPDELKRVLWWTFLKNETLKEEKVKNNDIRMIMCTDPVFTRYGAAFEEHQNNLMKERTETHQAQVGWSPFYGGLNQRLDRLSRFPNYKEIDWTRFDGTIPLEVFRHIKNIRFFFLSETYKTPENRARYKWYTHNLMYKVTLLPTGEVTLISRGNPSGQISTTTDNNMINTFLTAFEVAYFYYERTGKVPTVRDYYQNVDSICYGDDRLLSVSDDFNYDATRLPEMYKTIFGMWVKPSNIKESRCLEGLSFCGLTIIKALSNYYGVPNVNKILSTLEHPVRKLPDVTALWGKLISLRILCEFAPEYTKDFLDSQILRVKEFCQKENIQLPEVGKFFFKTIWLGGPKPWSKESKEEESVSASKEPPHQHQ